MVPNPLLCSLRCLFVENMIALATRNLTNLFIHWHSILNTDQQAQVAVVMFKTLKLVKLASNTPQMYGMSAVITGSLISFSLSLQTEMVDVTYIVYTSNKLFWIPVH